MAKCIATLKVCQGQDERQDYAFDLTKEFSIRWQPDYPYQSADVVRPNSNPGTGFEYSADSDGVSNGEAEPSWPTVLGESATDGSLSWTAQLPTNASLRHRIETVEWTAPPGITISDQVEIENPARQEARIWVSGGTAGQTYEIIGLITSTFSAAVFEVHLQVKVM